MDLAQIDENFEIKPITETDVEWFQIPQAPFSVHGVYYDETTQRFQRMPQEVADTVNKGVANLYKCTAGGRVRFMTNSPYVAIKYISPQGDPMWNLTWIGKCGFSVYAGDVFRGVISSRPNVKNVNGQFAFEGICYLPTLCLEEVTVCMPLYNGVDKLYIGLKKGCALQEAKPYTYEKPVVFYGSSITQGGCASHPGNEYQAHLSRWLGFDYIDLGFSGSGRGEQTMADYLASLHASVFVLDYDHNAPTKEHLENTHYPLYATIRAAHPDAPIVLISKPDFDSKPSNNAQRRDVIYQTYKRAKKQGDKRIWFIDGEKLFQKHDRSACTVDNVHPNDLGFYRMAQTIAPVLKKALKKSK